MVMTRKEIWTRYHRKKGFKPLVIKECIICYAEFRGKEKTKLCKKCQSLRNYRNWRARYYEKENCFSDKEWAQLLDKTEGKCNKCKKYVGRTELTQDHIECLRGSKKKFYKIKDIQALCKSCNSSKDNQWRC